MATYRRLLITVAGVVAVTLLAGVGWAQLNDLTQTPNAANEGIRKSLAQEIGTGRGNATTPDSSIFIIRRDPFRSVRRGRQIFQRKFRRAEGQGPRTQDGVGTNIFGDPSLGAGLADSCAACHGRPRGSAGFGGDVFTRPDSRDAPHLFGLGLQEMLADEITTDLRKIRTDALALAKSTNSTITRNLQSKGISYGSLRAFPNGTVDTANVRGVNPDLRVRPFFAQGGTISIREFLVGAFNAEMGLEAPDPDLITASGQAGEGAIRVVTPAGMVLDGTQDAIEPAPVSSPTQDGDGDGVVNEIPTSIVDHMEFYLLHYFKPAIGKSSSEASLGRVTFQQIGCQNCHIPNLTINRDRRVADVETNFDSSRGNPFNRLFAQAVPSFVQVNDGTGLPTLKNPAFGQFVVRNFFADLKRHDLGKNFHELQFNNTLNTQILTEPLWGAGTTAPYGHDGRSQSLEEVILRHGGEAQSARNAFALLTSQTQRWVIEFLQTLQLFPPDDTASSLQGVNRSDPDFPQRGHGAIALTVLFNNPQDIE